MGMRMTKGRCVFCNGTYSKNGMAKHLRTCAERRAVMEAEAGAKGKGSGVLNLFHIVIDCPYAPYYWLHVEIPEDATLEDLDDFLRYIWVECCGHLSAFTIHNMRFLSNVERDIMGMLWGFEEEGGDMDVPVGEVLYPGLKFKYEYDFGSTTELRLKVLGVRKGRPPSKAVMLLARNEPLDLRCEVCGKVATKVCPQCSWEGSGLLCDDCAPKHECGEDMMLPVVNSPRMGICGYEGPEEDLSSGWYFE